MKESGIGHVTIHEEGLAPSRTTPDDMAALAGGAFPLAERVPGARGEAFDWNAWYGRWRASPPERGRPSFLKVEAADGYEAVIPWDQLREAAVLYRLDGAPLAQGAPVRLYVPNGTSACLNVKSVVAFRIGYDPDMGSQASYGFKNTFAPGELRKR